MADHYLFHLNFDVRADAPPQLHSALGKRAEGEYPTREEVCDLPGIVQDYLCSGGVPGDGVYSYTSLGPRMKYRDGKMVEVGFEPHEGSHALRMALTFHDDEYFNGGIYFTTWLFQYAAHDGPIGTMQQTNGKDIPAILTRKADTIIETHLAYAPGEFWPLPGQAEPDGDAPIKIRRTTAMPLTELLEGMAFFADGHSYE